jgi:hypothetical protein
MGLIFLISVDKISVHVKSVFISVLWVERLLVRQCETKSAALPQARRLYPHAPAMHLYAALDNSQAHPAALDVGVQFVKQVNAISQNYP